MGREVGEKGEGSGGEGGGKWGRRGREVGERGRELGMGYPPVHPLISQDKAKHKISAPRQSSTCKYWIRIEKSSIQYKTH